MRVEANDLNLPGEILDLDLWEDDWHAIVQLDNESVELRSGTGAIMLPILTSHLMIRCLDGESVALIDANGSFRLMALGQIGPAIPVGRGIDSALVADEHLVLTWGDEFVIPAGARRDAASANSPATEALACFDLGGHFLWGYRSLYNERVVQCYGACLDDIGRLWFTPYMGFPLVRIDLAAVASGQATRARKVWPLPDELHFGEAITTLGSTLFAWRTVRAQVGTIRRYDLGERQPSLIGEFGGRRDKVRGLPDGRLLRVRPTGYDIVYMT